MSFDAESLQKHIPSYLTEEDQKVLFRELKALSSGGNADYILNPRNDSFRNAALQGDGWRGFQLFEFETGKKRSVRGLVLSNSCDIDPENFRDLPTRIIFAPLVNLNKYKNMLENSGLDSKIIEQKINSIIAQKTSNVFYLPASGALEDDYIIRLDELHSMPFSAHRESPDRQKLFTLSNTGFYMLVLKLSVHFCRLQEKINRSSF
ncbi:MAG: hypothetical protein OXE78_12790 [Gammaproteobacteria bacterium]|nr:hypothetical protein [Gammaproteobacteria bacterium]